MINLQSRYTLERTRIFFSWRDSCNTFKSSKILWAKCSLSLFFSTLKLSSNRATGLFSIQTRHLFTKRYTEASFMIKFKINGSSKAWWVTTEATNIFRMSPDSWLICWLKVSNWFLYKTTFLVLIECGNSKLFFSITFYQILKLREIMEARVWQTYL